MPHGLTIDHEGNTWLTDVAMHQVRTQYSQSVFIYSSDLKLKLLRTVIDGPNISQCMTLK